VKEVDDMFVSKLVSKVMGSKRRWWAYQARVRELPPIYRAAVEALERYLFLFGRGDGAGWAEMLEDLADLFERAAADGTPIREIFGDDPAEFVETFVQNYPEARYVDQERERLRSAIARAAGEDTRNDERAIG
jgi:DNA-binding ferritin-like protein (Dps family)